MLPGFGQQPRFIVTIQPAGAVFNPPAPITLPNVDGLRPREVTEMYSFDHDIGSFVAIGTGVVSADGQVIRSSEGVGVLKAGWHCGGNPAISGTAATCPTCHTCIGNQCVTDDSKTPPEKCASCDNGRPVPPKTTDQCCAEGALANPSMTDGGYVVCCNGKHTACLNPAAYPGGTVGNNIVKLCGFVHEEEHFKDLDDCPVGPNECAVTQPSGVRPGHNMEQSECDAYIAGLACLLSSGSVGCAGDEECAETVAAAFVLWDGQRQSIPGCVIR